MSAAAVPPTTAPTPAVVTTNAVPPPADQEPTATHYIEAITNSSTATSTPSPATSPSTVTATSVPPSATAAATMNGSTANVYNIGLEFVRQYYTVLHQGPLYLHRFYSEHSIYVHDDSRVVRGQQEIRERIHQLNFRNCVAKIIQVDSQETLGDGVVIQVRGELSNNGKPLRRFMQTFVLAPQSPKRYYVRNDIFHYEEDDPKEDLNTSTGLDSSMSNENDHGDDEKSDDDDDSERIPSVSACSPTSMPDVSSTIIKSDLETGHLPPTAVVEVSVLDAKPVEDEKQEKDPRRLSHGFVTTPTPTTSGDEETKSNKDAKDGEMVGSSASTTGVKTFANLFKSPGVQPFSSATTASPFPNTATNRITYPDTHQLFVGNLPHTVTHLEVKNIFADFGTVAEVKILKPNNKNAGPKVPYFCFVVFENESSATAALNARDTITMKMADGSNRRLNVEEKRTREGFTGNHFARNNTNMGHRGPNRHTRTFRGSSRGGGSGGERGGGGAR